MKASYPFYFIYSGNVLSLFNRQTPTKLNKNIKVAITGASGLIGTKLISSLSSRGVDVITIGRSNTSAIVWNLNEDNSEGSKDKYVIIVV